jgi:hypothetical protein
VNDTEREQWVNNDEGLYLWWQRSKQPITKFVKQHRKELDEHIKKCLA